MPSIREGFNGPVSRYVYFGKPCGHDDSRRHDAALIVDGLCHWASHGLDLLVDARFPLVFKIVCCITGHAASYCLPNDDLDGRQYRDCVRFVGRVCGRAIP